MGLLEDFFLGTPKNDMERLLDRAMGEYQLDRASGNILDSLWTSEDEELDRESKRADIAYKRHLAGLPNSTEDYDNAVNNGLSFKEKGVLAAFGVKASNQMPDTRNFKPKTSDSFSGVLKSAKTEGTSPKLAEDLYHSILGRGAKNGRRISAIAKYFR